MVIEWRLFYHWSDSIFIFGENRVLQASYDFFWWRNNRKVIGRKPSHQSGCRINMFDDSPGNIAKLYALTLQTWYCIIWQPTKTHNDHDVMMSWWQTHMQLWVWVWAWEWTILHSQIVFSFKSHSLRGFLRLPCLITANYNRKILAWTFWGPAQQVLRTQFRNARSALASVSETSCHS